MKKHTNEKSNSVTKWLAYGITFIVLLGTAGIAIYALLKDKIDLLQTIIPLWGTWLGTILAFYFGKNNFDAAAKSYQNVIEKLTPAEKMAKLLVKDYMVPLEKLVSLTYDKVKNEKIYEILGYEQFKPYKRFSFLDNDGAAKYIIHRSLFTQFISSKVNENQNIEAIRNLTLEDFINNSDDSIKNILKNSFAVVSINSTLLEAKVKIDFMSECQDVFITKTGAANEKVEGLITNNLILKEANF